MGKKWLYFHVDEEEYETLLMMKRELFCKTWRDLLLRLVCFYVEHEEKTPRKKFKEIKEKILKPEIQEEEENEEKAKWVEEFKKMLGDMLSSAG